MANIASVHSGKDIPVKIVKILKYLCIGWVAVISQTLPPLPRPTATQTSIRAWQVLHHLETGRSLEACRDAQAQVVSDWSVWPTDR